MKRKILLSTVVFTVILAFQLKSQGYYYLPATGTVDYKYNTLGTVVMQGTTTGIGDTLTAWQTIPFTWDFYGQPVNGFFISDNGYITFDPNAKGSQSKNVSLPDTNAPRNAIFALWDELNLIRTASTGDYLIHTWTLGTAPNRVFVIHWFNIHHESKLGDADTRFFFAIRLYESGPKKFDIVHDMKLNTTVTSTATVGVQNQDGTLATMVGGSPSYNFPSLGSAGTDDAVFEFYTNPQPAYDMSVTSITIPKYHKISTTVPVTGTIRNLGSQTVTSFTLNYSVDGGTVVSQLISAVSILPGAVYAFRHPSDWITPTTEKTYNIVIWATNINGNSDLHTANDSANTNVQVIANSVQRLPLHEVFTSSTCPPCKAGNENLQSIFETYPDNYTCVKYQMNFPGTGDPYYTTECGDRSNFYGYINSIPRLQVDGGWNSNPGGYTEELFDSFYHINSFMELSATFKLTDKRVDVTATINPLTDFNTTNLKLFVAVVEKATHNNVKTNGETEFYWVLKKMLSNSGGNALSAMTKNTKVNVSKFFTFKGVYTLPADGQSPINLSTQYSVEEFTDLTAVVWVQDAVTREVYQSAWAVDLSSIAEDKNEFNMVVYPNPVGNDGKVTFKLQQTQNVSVEVYDIFGKRLYTSGDKNLVPGSYTYHFDASGFNPGTYLLVLRAGDKMVSKAFIR